MPTASGVGLCHTAAGMNIWLKTALALAVLWACALGGIYWLRASRATVASLTDAFAHANLNSKSPTDRARTLHGIEDGLNDLSFEERQNLQRNGMTRQFFLSLTPAEQSAFLDATLPTDFKQLMEAFNKMDPAKRKHVRVPHALEQMQKHEGEPSQPHTETRRASRPTHHRRGPESLLFRGRRRAPSSTSPRSSNRCSATSRASGG